MYVITFVFRACISDLRMAIELVKQGVNVADDAVSGLIFSDDFLGISKPPKGECRNKQGKR